MHYDRSNHLSNTSHLSLFSCFYNTHHLMLCHLLSFFWPAMPLADVMKKLDSSRKQPHVVQSYSVPGRSQWKDPETSIHDSAIYSMWTHFTEYCNSVQNGWIDTQSKSLGICMNTWTCQKLICFILTIRRFPII